MYTFVWTEVVLPVISAGQLDAVGLDGVVVGAGDHGQAHVLTSAEDEGVEGANSKD
jgi:hypothetical protein